MTWLEEQIKDKKNEISECEAGDKLTWFRSFEQYYRCVSVGCVAQIKFMKLT